LDESSCYGDAIDGIMAPTRKFKTVGVTPLAGSTTVLVKPHKTTKQSE